MQSSRSSAYFWSLPVSCELHFNHQTPYKYWTLLKLLWWLKWGGDLISWWWQWWVQNDKEIRTSHAVECHNLSSIVHVFSCKFVVWFSWDRLFVLLLQWFLKCLVCYALLNHVQHFFSYRKLKLSVLVWFDGVWSDLKYLDPHVVLQLLRHLIYLYPLPSLSSPVKRHLNILKPWGQSAIQIFSYFGIGSTTRHCWVYFRRLQKDDMQ